jgi:hypothetical protein
MPRGGWRWLTCVMLAGAWCAPARAQTVEVAAGSGLASGWGDGAFASTYAPPFPFVEHTGRASQLVVLQRDAAAVLWTSLTWFGGPRVGLEGRVDYRRPGLHGVNGPHAVTLTYTARRPPDFVPRQYSYESVTPWPDTEGHAGQLTATASVVVRVGAPSRASLRLLGGGGVTSLRGRMEPVGYTTFTLGGHSVLFADEHRLSMRYGPSAALGLSAGAELHVPTGKHAAIVVGWRLFVPRLMELAVTADGLAASDQGINPLQFDDVQRTLAPSPIQWRPVTSDLTAGVAVRF